MWRRIPHCDEPLFFATCCEMSFQQKYRNIKSRGMRPYKHEHYPINVNFCYVVFRISELLIIKYYQALQYSATGRGIQFLPSTQKQCSGISLRKISPLATPPYSHFSRLVGILCFMVALNHSSYVKNGRLSKIGLSEEICTMTIQYTYPGGRWGVMSAAGRYAKGGWCL